MTELYKLPEPSKMRIRLKDGNIADCTFHHVDGGYSYCTIDDVLDFPDVKSKVFHLSASSELIEVDGRWELLAQQKDGKI